MGTDPLMQPAQPARFAEHRPPTAHDPRLRGGITVRCVCGHNQARHEVPGFDGECIAEGCRCTSYTERQPAIAPPAPLPTNQPTDRTGRIDTVEQLVAVARELGDRRALLVIGRIQSMAAELHALIAAHHARARDDAYKAQLAQLAKPERAKRPYTVTYGEHPCRIEGCDYVATTKQGRASHERNAHQDLDLPCPGCSQRFRTKFLLAAHSRTHARTAAS